MSELDLDKIERTYTGVSGKKYDLESVRIASGRMRPKHVSVIRRDLTGVMKKTSRRI